MGFRGQHLDVGDDLGGSDGGEGGGGEEGEGSDCSGEEIETHFGDGGTGFAGEDEVMNRFGVLGDMGVLATCCLVDWSNEEE